MEDLKEAIKSDKTEDIKSMMKIIKNCDVVIIPEVGEDKDNIKQRRKQLLVMALLRYF